MNDFRSFLKLFLPFFFSFIVTLIVVFLLKSSTNKFLQQTGPLNWYKQNETSFQKWSRKIVSLLNGYFQTVWNQIFMLSQALWKLLMPVRNWINLTVPPVLEKIEKDYWPSILQTLRWFLTLINDNFLVVRQIINKLIFKCEMWLQQNVLVGPIAPDKLQCSLVSLVEAGQYYMVQVYTWTYDHLKILLN